VNAYQEAFEKGEANSNFMNQNQTKFHLVVRFTLSKGDKKYKENNSRFPFNSFILERNSFTAKLTLLILSIHLCS